MKKKLYKRLFLLLVLIYLAFTFINQQKVLSRYTANSNNLNEKIENERKNQEELLSKQNNINSKEFIEDTAREKLDMYYPNEKVYIDNGM